MQARSGDDPLPKLGESQSKEEENHGPGRNKEPGGRAEEGKSGGAKIPESLDMVEPPKEEANIGRPTNSEGLKKETN